MKGFKLLVPLTLGAAQFGLDSDLRPHTWPHVWSEQRPRKRLGGGPSLQPERPAPRQQAQAPNCWVHLGVRLFLEDKQTPQRVKGEITADGRPNHFWCIPGLRSKGGLDLWSTEGLFQRWRREAWVVVAVTFLALLASFLLKRSFTPRCLWVL